jgi:SPP1 gp7 family putative phage head morphogenesis protein
MNRRQKEVQQQFLNNEKAVLKQLERNYQDALDEINSKIELLLARQDADMQHVIYQVEYQKALKTQVQAILEQLQNNEFETLSEYLTGAYEDGFIGTMYDLQGQGIPLVFPIDQEQVIAAIQHETQLSSALYVALGHDIKDLQKKIAGEISRGISTGATYSEMARNIASYARIPKNRAMTIARTEAHRIQCAATANAQWKAKEKGADVVKQWDASLDGKTRATHRELDGQIRELDEPFEVAGKKAMHPGDFGDPAEDCNCRCALLQRARWALEADIPVTKWSPDAPVLIADDGTTQFIDMSDAKNYKQFKDRYQERVRQGAQMMNKRSTTESVFDTFNATKADSIRPRSVMNEMKKSQIGSDILEYLEAEGVPVRLCYGIDNPKDDFGGYDPFDDVIIVYCDKTKTVKETASTIIHEAKHRMLGCTGTKQEEIECFKAEILHKKGELTQDDINAIIKLVNDKYPDLE